MAVPPETRSFKVAIVGAGIAGLGCAIALDRIAGLADLDVAIYEQASSLHEVGASIALGPNGLLLLRKLGLNDLTRQGYQNPDGTDHIWRQGKTGKIISNTIYPGTPDESLRTARYTRWHVHTALKNAVPSEGIHLGKRVQSITAHDSNDRVSLLNGRVEITFEDGTSQRADLVIGADGLRSAVRKAYAPDYPLPFSGAIAYRDIYDWDLVKDIPNLPEGGTHWLSKSGVTFFTSRMPDNKFGIACFVSGAKGDNDGFRQKWDKLGDMDVLRPYFKDWYPPLKQLMDTLPYVHSYPVFSAIESLDTWVYDDSVVLIGDAAHPHGGSFAAGGSLALEDSFALSLALKHTFSSARTLANRVSSLSQALRLYDQTRCAHGKRVIDAVSEKKYGWLASGITGGEEQTPNVYDEFTNEVKYPLWIIDHSVEDEFKQKLVAAAAVALVA